MSEISTLRTGETYSVTRSGGCTLIAGAMPLDDFAALTSRQGKDSVMSPDLARLAGVQIAFGPKDAVSALIAELSPPAEREAANKHPQLDPDAARWLASGEQGLSSATMFRAFTGVVPPTLASVPPAVFSTPVDPDDFKLCRLLLENVPAFENRLAELRVLSPKWAALVDHWQTLAELMDSEAPRWREGVGYAPETARCMKELGL
jgi:hypothetical protein